jgi:TolB protein
VPRGKHGTGGSPTSPRVGVDGSSMRARALGVAFALAGALWWAVPVALAQQSPLHSGSPAVSPDGTRIAFLADGGGSAQVWVIGVDGSGAHAVPGAGRGRPRWSPDGRSILITGGGAEDSGHVALVPADGGTRRIVASVPGRNPVLSPDGRQAAFLTGPWTSTSLVVANADGSDMRVVAGGSATAWNPAWSPDGRQLAYTYGDSTHVLQVHIVNADGTGDRAVTHMSKDQGSAQLPVWSADGRFLAVQVNNASAHTAHIWIVNAAGGQARLVAPHDRAYLDEIPAWFPDGKHLALQSNRGGSMQIWVVNVDGTEAVQVTR